MNTTRYEVKMREKREIELSESISIIVKWFDDEDGDTSWLGKLQHTEPDGTTSYIDLVTGNLFFPDKFNLPTYLPTRINFGKYFYDADDMEYYRYWVPMNDHADPDSWSHVSEEDIERVRAEHGGNLGAQYLIEDCRRLLSYGKDWNFLGCTVCVKYNDTVIGRASLWGIEDDSDESYFDIVEKEVISEALSHVEKNITMISEDNVALSRIKEAYSELEKELSEVV